MYLNRLRDEWMCLFCPRILTPYRFPANPHNQETAPIKSLASLCLMLSIITKVPDQYTDIIHTGYRILSPHSPTTWTRYLSWTHHNTNNHYHHHHMMCCICLWPRPPWPWRPWGLLMLSFYALLIWMYSVWTHRVHDDHHHRDGHWTESWYCGGPLNQEGAASDRTADPKWKRDCHWIWVWILQNPHCIWWMRI